MRNQHEMQRIEQLQQHQAQHYRTIEEAYAVNGALGHFAEGRYP